MSIRTDNSRVPGNVPSLSDFYVYGGLYRYTEPGNVPALLFSRMKVTADVSGSVEGSLQCITKVDYDKATFKSY